jgi:hypothetical protein
LSIKCTSFSKRLSNFNEHSLILLSGKSDGQKNATIAYYSLLPLYFMKNYSCNISLILEWNPLSMLIGGGGLEPLANSDNSRVKFPYFGGRRTWDLSLAPEDGWGRALAKLRNPDFMGSGFYNKSSVLLIIFHIDQIYLRCACNMLAAPRATATCHQASLILALLIRALYAQ